MKQFAVLIFGICITVISIAQPSFTEHLVDGDFGGARDVTTVDLDNDGDIDIVAAASHDSEIAWWENDGDQNFTKHTVDSLYYPGRAKAIDMDNDGDLDILASSYFGGEIAWFENDGSQQFTKYSIDNIGMANDVQAIDMDNDGDVDVLASSFDQDEVSWWENDGNQNFTKMSIDSILYVPANLFPVDIDNDGDIDVLGAIYGDNDIVWWENDGFQSFTKHTIASSFNRARAVYAIDLDFDGDLDVLGAAETADDITWWENDGSQNFTEHNIDPSFDGATDVYAADMDNDGDLDILGAGASYSSNQMAWWENDGYQNFTKHNVDPSFNYARSVHAEDIDNDGDLDIIGAAQTDGDISWWENDLISDKVLTFDGTDDYISMGDVDAVDNVSQLTVAGWFYFDNAVSNMRLVSNQVKGTSTGWNVSLGGSNTGGKDDVKFAYNLDGNTLGTIYTDGSRLNLRTMVSHSSYL